MIDSALKRVASFFEIDTTPTPYRPDQHDLPSSFNVHSTPVHKPSRMSSLSPGSDEENDSSDSEESDWRRTTYFRIGAALGTEDSKTEQKNKLLEALDEAFCKFSRHFIKYIRDEEKDFDYTTAIAFTKIFLDIRKLDPDFSLVDTIFQRVCNDIDNGGRGNIQSATTNAAEMDFIRFENNALEAMARHYIKIGEIPRDELHLQKGDSPPSLDNITSTSKREKVREVIAFLRVHWIPCLVVWNFRRAVLAAGINFKINVRNLDDNTLNELYDLTASGDVIVHLNLLRIYETANDISSDLEDYFNRIRLELILRKLLQSKEQSKLLSSLERYADLRSKREQDSFTPIYEEAKKLAESTGIPDIRYGEIIKAALLYLSYNPNNDIQHLVDSLPYQVLLHLAKPGKFFYFPQNLEGKNIFKQINFLIEATLRRRNDKLEEHAALAKISAIDDISRATEVAKKFLENSLFARARFILESKRPWISDDKNYYNKQSGQKSYLGEQLEALADELNERLICIVGSNNAKRHQVDPVDICENIIEKAQRVSSGVVSEKSPDPVLLPPCFVPDQGIASELSSNFDELLSEAVELLAKAATFLHKIQSNTEQDAVDDTSILTVNTLCDRLTRLNGAIPKNLEARKAIYFSMYGLFRSERITDEEKVTIIEMDFQKLEREILSKVASRMKTNRTFFDIRRSELSNPDKRLHLNRLDRFTIEEVLRSEWIPIVLFRLVRDAIISSGIDFQTDLKNAHEEDLSSSLEYLSSPAFDNFLSEIRQPNHSTDHIISEVEILTLNIKIHLIERHADFIAGKIRAWNAKFKYPDKDDFDSVNSFEKVFVASINFIKTMNPDTPKDICDLCAFDLINWALRRLKSDRITFLKWISYDALTGLFMSAGSLIPSRRHREVVSDLRDAIEKRGRIIRKRDKLKANLEFTKSLSTTASISSSLRTTYTAISRNAKEVATFAREHRIPRDLLHDLSERGIAIAKDLNALSTTIQQSIQKPRSKKAKEKIFLETPRVNAENAFEPTSPDIRRAAALSLLRTSEKPRKPRHNEGARKQLTFSPDDNP